MQAKAKKIRLKGNESFNFREGWLRKGMRCVAEDPLLFSRDDVMERLGVGSKMVKSIKYWLLATGLCEERYINNGHNRALYFTKDFGEIVDQYDRYFDDIFTLFLLHYHIVTNKELCIVWNIFFNDFSGVDFTRDGWNSVCSDCIQKIIEPGVTFSERLLADDCASVIRMYQPSMKNDDPEESLQCPLNALGLIAKSSKAKNAFNKTAPSKNLLDKMMILYVMVKNIPDGKNSIRISDLVEAPNNIGKIFNLSRTRINEYLDQLRASGFITVNRTAGLDVVYLNGDFTSTEILKDYYIKFR